MLNPKSLCFLDDLQQNNNKEWFAENKKQYEDYKKDYHQLVCAFLNAIKPLDASLELLEVKNCTFRINKDIRFSKDKSPYKTHMGIWIASGLKNANSAGYYIHIEKNGCFIGGGMYSPTPEQLQKIRKEINYFHEDLDKIIRDKKFQSEYKDFNRDEKILLKTPPRGYDKQHPAIEYLKLKSFTAIQNFDIKEVTKPEFVEKMVEKLIVLKPLNDFLNRGLASD